MKRRRRSIHKRKVVIAAILILFAGCSAAESMMEGDEASGWNGEGAPGMDEDWGYADGDGEAEAGDSDWDFVPEEEEFLVQQVASTESYVFVPNQAEDSDTVALIDGWDFSVRPIRVGRDPKTVVAADVEGHGSVGYVLSTGVSTVAVVRADLVDAENRVDVRLLPVPQEVNQLAISPDGRHVLAYIDPNEPINASASAASLQTMALVRLGDGPGQDEVYHLSVTRLIEAIAFTEDSKQAFVVGREGINRLPLEDIKADAFLPTIDLGLSSSVFSPVDQEVVFSSDGSFLVARTSQYAGVGLFELDPTDPNVTSHRVIELSGIPTDLDLVEREGEPALVVATIRSESQVALFEVDEALNAEEEDLSFLRFLDATGADAGIGRLTPDESQMVVFSTLPTQPALGLVDLETESMSTLEMRNQIRNLAISPDSRTAVAVHRRQPGPAPTAEWEDRFRHSEGLTLWDLRTGYLRPVVLEADPEEILMITGPDGGAYLYVMLVSPNEAYQGVMRIDLQTHRSDFLRLPRRPMQLGVVAGRVFISQEDATGRITFLDVETNEQRTVSGYELNAGIR